MFICERQGQCLCFRLASLKILGRQEWPWIRILWPPLPKQTGITSMSSHRGALGSGRWGEHSTNQASSPSLLRTLLCRQLPSLLHVIHIILCVVIGCLHIIKMKDRHINFNVYIWPAVCRWLSSGNKRGAMLLTETVSFIPIAFMGKFVGKQLKVFTSAVGEGDAPHVLSCEENKTVQKVPQLWCSWHLIFKD